jgi:oxygen-independent coproporphyrinogen-3 oxidase
MYTRALEAELKTYGAGQRVHSVFFGGGTPSLLSVKQFDDLMSVIRSNFVLDESAEITIEANPGTVDYEYLAAIRSLGINRISLGVQSLDDADLTLLGRIHTAAEARDAFRFAREAGFANINLDIIYGIPGYAIDQWKYTLEEVVGLAPQHLSLYPLTLEGDEPLYNAIARGEIDKLDADATADQYELAEEILKAHGYNHYEISNWSIAGHECQHNMVYWLGGNYIGVGVAAHSYVDGRRYANTPDLDKYLAFSGNQRTNICEMEERIGPEIELAEAVILGLRLTRGVDVSDIRSRFNVNLLDRYSDQVEELTALGLVECDAKSISLTSRGRLLGNEVFWRFLP